MRHLTEDEREIFGRLQLQLMKFTSRNRLRRDYYEGEKLLTNLGFSIPEGMEAFKTPIGWPRKAVSTFASRLVPAGYSADREDGLLGELEDVMSGSMFPFLERLAIEAACRYGVSFVFTTAGDTAIGESEVVNSVCTALQATVDLDPRTWRVRAALERIGEAQWNLYLPHMVLEVRKGKGAWLCEERPTGTPRVLCAAYVHGAIAGKTLGQSRITRPLMAFTDAGVRTLLRQEVSAEFYSAPRQALLGADESMFRDKNGNLRPGWAAIIGGIWGIPDLLDEDGNVDKDARPEFHNLPQMSMQPFNDQFRMIAQMVSGESSIPPSYLGVVSDSNPASAEAIFANELDLINEVKAQWPSFNLGRTQVARNMLTVARRGELDDIDSKAFVGLKPRWADPRTRSVAEQSNYVAQQVQVGNFQPGSETTLRQLPIDPEDVELFASEATRARGNQYLDALLAADSARVEAPAVA